MNFKDRRDQQEFDKEAVTISFQTRADLGEMTDEELRDLGKFVVEIAADKRRKQAEGLV